MVVKRLSLSCIVSLSARRIAVPVYRTCCLRSDALLADLETTRALSGDTTVGDDYYYDDDDIDDDNNNNNKPATTTMYYQQQEQRQTYSRDSRGRSSPTPPPLPPLPSREFLDTVHPSAVSCCLRRRLYLPTVDNEDGFISYSSHRLD